MASATSKPSSHPSVKSVLQMRTLRLRARHHQEPAESGSCPGSHRTCPNDSHPSRARSCPLHGRHGVQGSGGRTHAAGCTPGGRAWALSTLISLKVRWPHKQKLPTRRKTWLPSAQITANEGGAECTCSGSPSVTLQGRCGQRKIPAQEHSRSLGRQW